MSMLNDKVDETQEELERFSRKLKDETNCQLPAIIQTVNEDGTVDCLVIRNDEEKNTVFPNISIKHLETNRAFVYLGVVKGDKGIIRFFDRSVENYKVDGTQDYNGDPRQHSISDSCFEIGFIPQKESYAFPKDKTIAVGNKNGSFLLTIGDNGQLICKAESYEFNGKAKFNNDVEFAAKIHAADEISSDSDVKAAGKSLKIHAHTSGAPGDPTSPPN